MYQFDPALALGAQLAFAPLLAYLLRGAALVASLFCVVAAICRLTVMCPRTTTKYTWSVMYVALGGLACWMSLILASGAPIGTHEQATAILAAAYLFCTRASWAHGLPSVARKDCPAKTAAHTPASTPTNAEGRAP